MINSVIAGLFLLHLELSYLLLMRQPLFGQLYYYIITWHINPTVIVIAMA